MKKKRRRILFLLAALGLMALVLSCQSIPPPVIAEARSPRDQLVVFDIDGTLTPHNWRVLEVRADAAKTVQRFADEGYHIVYLTARVPGFQFFLPSWLEKNDFPTGDLFVAENAQEREQVADYKAKVLERYRQHGWSLAYAFGDSATDFVAYERAGLPKDRVFALKVRGQDDCAAGSYQACLEGWGDFLKKVEIRPAK